MGRKPSAARTSGVGVEATLLDDLNDIANYVIGNQAPEDVTINERSTLPEAIAYLSMYPKKIEAITDSLKKLSVLDRKIKKLVSDIELLKLRWEVSNRRKL